MIMHLSTKGQVTIPLAIREKSGLRPGSAVEVFWQKGSVVLKPALDSERTPGKQLLGRIVNSGVRPVMSTEKLMKLTRGEDD